MYVRVKYSRSYNPIEYTSKYPRKGATEVGKIMKEGVKVDETVTVEVSDCSVWLF